MIEPIRVFPISNATIEVASDYRLPELDGLSTRAKNACLNADLLSRADIKKAYENGKLKPGYNYDRYGDRKGGIRGIGRKTFLVLVNWAGIELAKPKPRKRCPHCGALLKQSKRA